MGIPAAEPGASHLQQPHGCEQDGEADGEVEGGGLPTPRDGLIAGTVAGMAQVRAMEGGGRSGMQWGDAMGRTWVREGSAAEERAPHCAQSR